MSAGAGAARSARELATRSWARRTFSSKSAAENGVDARPKERGAVFGRKPRGCPSGRGGVGPLVGVVVQVEELQHGEPKVHRPEGAAVHRLTEQVLHEVLELAPLPDQPPPVDARDVAVVVLVDPDVVEAGEDDVEQRLGEQAQPDQWLLVRQRGDDARLGEERDEDPVLDLDEEVLLRADVVVERALPQSDRVAELSGTGGGVPLLGEQARRRVDDLLAPGLVAGAVAGRSCHGCSSGMRGCGRVQTSRHSQRASVRQGRTASLVVRRTSATRPTR